MTRRRRISLVATLAICAAIVAAAALARTSTGRRATASLGIRVQPEPFTTLSLLHPATLGGRQGVVYDGARIHDRVAFRIGNEEHRAERYHWTISFSPSGRTYRGAVSVAAGGQVVMSPRVLLPCDGTPTRSHPAPRRAQVRVALQPSGDLVAFWQACGG